MISSLEKRIPAELKTVKKQAGKAILPSPPETTPKARTFRQRGGRVCAGNPGRVSCTMMIPIFQNFFEVLKNASACRKDFFDTLKSDAEKSVGFFHECDFVTERQDETCYDKSITKNRGKREAT